MSKLIFNTSGFVDSDNPDNYTSKSSFIIDKDLSSLIFEFSGGGKPVYYHVTDPDGLVRVQFLGKQGPKTTVLHEDESGSGIGTCPGKIRKGKWMITAFAFGARCSSSSGKVDYEVKVFENTYKSNPDNLYSSWLNLKEFNSGRIFLKAFENSQNIQGGNEPSEINDEECRWLKGDFHVHSYLSDGSSSPAELLEEGLNKKLDFFFITEHGILSPSFPEKNGITVFPSLELTTSSGHFNLHGLKYLPDNIHDKGPDPEWSHIEKIMSDAGESGALISINHPLHYPWLWLYNDLPLSMIDAVEIISDPYAEGASEANDRALRLLDLIWNEGYRISGIGGSDTHTAYSESQLGQPVTEVYSIPGSLKSLLKAVKNHNAAVFTDLTGGSLEYQIEGKAVVSGTEINHREDLDLEAVFDPGGCDESFILRIIENGITVDEAVTLPLCKTSVKRKWNGKSDWLRCELRDKNNMIRGYLNPLHRKSCFPDSDQNDSSIQTWGDALKLMD